MTGPYAWSYWALILCNVLDAAAPVVQAHPHERGDPVRHLLIVNVGMWLERFVIVVTSLSQDFLPSSSWDTYAGTKWDWMLYIGTMGFFGALVFLFIRFLPMISIFEMRTLVPQAGGAEKLAEDAARKEGRNVIGFGKKPKSGDSFGWLAEFANTDELLDGDPRLQARRLPAHGGVHAAARARGVGRARAQETTCRSSCSPAG